MYFEVFSVSLRGHYADVQCYSLTPKGQQFLEGYKEYDKINKHVEKVLNDFEIKKANLERLFGQ